MHIKPEVSYDSKIVCMETFLFCFFYRNILVFKTIMPFKLFSGILFQIIEYLLTPKIFLSI